MNQTGGKKAETKPPICTFPHGLVTHMLYVYIYVPFPMAWLPLAANALRQSMKTNRSAPASIAAMEARVTLAALAGRPPPVLGGGGGGGGGGEKEQEKVGSCVLGDILFVTSHTYIHTRTHTPICTIVHILHFEHSPVLDDLSRLIIRSSSAQRIPLRER